jgi:hypothetical protein
MHSINSAVKSDTTIDSAIQLPAGQGISIATIGADHLFTSLRIRRPGEIIELTIPPGRTGRYDAEEFGREATDDEGDSVNIAIDMQRAARKRPNGLGAGTWMRARTSPSNRRISGKPSRTSLADPAPYSQQPQPNGTFARRRGVGQALSRLPDHTGIAAMTRQEHNTIHRLNGAGAPEGNGATMTTREVTDEPASAAVPSDSSVSTGLSSRPRTRPTTVDPAAPGALFPADQWRTVRDHMA